MAAAKQEVPEQFGKYELLRHLATGGMAEVYLARQLGPEGFEKAVVIKCLREELLGHHETTGSFLDEARLVASLEHPNIAGVYDMGVANGVHYLAMEYVQGADLRQLLQKLHAGGRTLPLGAAVFIVSHLCAALHFAHEKRDRDGRALGIVHRDISPSNVLLSHTGAVKLCDFGIAKANNQSHETQAGVLKGKYSYMSPEQCQCLPLNRRSDIFSLGIILHEITTMRRLFYAPSEFAVLREIIEGVVPAPSTRVADYPPELERIVMRALEKDPSKRYQSAQEMQLDLEAFARNEKLPQSAILVAELMGTCFDPNEGKLNATAPAQGTRSNWPGTRRSSPALTRPTVSIVKGTGIPPRSPRRGPFLMITGAVAALAAGIAAPQFTPAPPADTSSLHAAAIANAAERVSAVIDQATQLARTRADGLSSSPVLRAAISTDAATVKDLIANEQLFTPSPAETVEVFHLGANSVTPWVRLPASARPLKPPAAGQARVEAGENSLVAIASAPIRSSAGDVDGLVVVSTPLQLGAAGRDVAEHTQAAWIEGLASPVRVHGEPSDSNLAARVPIATEVARDPPLQLAFVPTVGPAPHRAKWVRPVQVSGFGVAGALIALYALSRRRRAQQP